MPELILISRPRLVPVVEVSAGGVNGLERSELPGLVPTARLVEADGLKRVVARHGEETGQAALSEPGRRSALSGGLALYSDGELLEEPQCCCDLGGIEDWLEAAGYRGDAWVMLWTGHPWLSVRFEDGLLHLSAPGEGEGEPVGRYCVRPEDLARAVAEAREELEAFARRLRPVVEAEVGGEAGEAVARGLAGLDGRS